ncbi:hypothetical protein D3C81_2055980 [compost metagenome]
MGLAVFGHEQRIDGSGIIAIFLRVAADDGRQFRALFLHIGVQRGLKVIERRHARHPRWDVGNEPSLSLCKTKR